MQAIAKITLIITVIKYLLITIALYLYRVYIRISGIIAY